jgi:acetyl esterase/lipase
MRTYFPLFPRSSILGWLYRRFSFACPIDWQPNAYAPVFFGMRNYPASVALDGAPTACRVFFPSLDGAFSSAPILDGCGRYPLVLFAHGNCINEQDHYTKWFELPAQLARSGYVVVVPSSRPSARAPIRSARITISCCSRPS